MSQALRKSLRPLVVVLAITALGYLAASYSRGSLGNALHWLRNGMSEAADASSDIPRVMFEQAADGNVTVAVTGLNNAALKHLQNANLTNTEWSQLLALYVGESLPNAESSTPAMLGEYRIEGKALRFSPRFPLVEGLTYTARFNADWLRAKLQAKLHVNDDGKGSDGVSTQESSLNAAIVTASFQMPQSKTTAATVVAQVYPTSNELPANQLKLYLHFSAPMSIGEAYDRVRLFDDKGKEMPRAFLRLASELWSQDHKRLTLWFDPGRIKRGLRPNHEFGAPLTEGKRYRLEVDPTWLDENGKPLAEKYVKEFVVIAADRQSPNQNDWQILAPEVGSNQSLTIIFSEPMDSALLESALAVYDAQGNLIEGRIEITEGEQRWLFYPNAAWQEGDYRLEVKTSLEDRAGNSLRNLFDMDLQSAPSTAAEAHSTITLPFSVAVIASQQK